MTVRPLLGSSTMPHSPAPTSRQRALLGQVSDMDLRLLRIFKSVVECGGMTAAELELNISTVTSVFGAPIVIFMMLKRQKGKR